MRGSCIGRLVEYLHVVHEILGVIAYLDLYMYNNQINARALIGQSAMAYCASKPMEILRGLRIII